MTERNQWSRQPKESSEAFVAFCHYLFLEPGARSIDAAFADSRGHQKSTKTAPRHWKEWSTEHQWVTRVQAYDDHLTAKRFFLEEEQVIARSRNKARERDRIEEIEKEIGDALVDKAREMLKWSHVRKTVVEKYGDGREKTITLEPKKWTAQSITRFIEVADKMLRLSAGMHTDITRVDSNVVIDDAVTFILNVAQRTIIESEYDKLLDALTPQTV